jgi:hypothetical protein
MKVVRNNNALMVSLFAPADYHLMDHSLVAINSCIPFREIQQLWDLKARRKALFMCYFKVFVFSSTLARVSSIPADYKQKFHAQSWHSSQRSPAMEAFEAATFKQSSIAMDSPRSVTTVQTWSTRSAVAHRKDYQEERCIDTHALCLSRMGCWFRRQQKIIQKERSTFRSPGKLSWEYAKWTKIDPRPRMKTPRGGGKFPTEGSSSTAMQHTQ